MTKNYSEHRLLRWLVIAQWLLILDFILLMPLGPDITRGLGLPLDHVGYISGAYALASALVLLAFASRLDRFDRVRSLVLVMGALGFSGITTSFSTGLYSLLVTRIMAGSCAGLASSILMALVIDQTPPERRGRAVAQIAGAFSLAAVLGVPVGLQLSLWFDWTMSFQLLGILTLVQSVLLWKRFGHDSSIKPDIDTAKPVGQQRTQSKLNTTMITGLACVAVAIFSGFLLIPHLAGYLQYNLNLEREWIGPLYMIGGIATYFVTRWSGYMADTINPLYVNVTGLFGFIFAVTCCFIKPGFFPVSMVFVLFMTSNAVRTVSSQTLLAGIPQPWQRAHYMGMQTATRHIVTGLAALISSLIITQSDSGALNNTTTLAGLAIIVALLLPVLLQRLTKQLQKRPLPEVNQPINSEA